MAACLICDNEVESPDGKHRYRYCSACRDGVDDHGDTALTRRNRMFKHRYGITLRDFRLMLEAQGNACAACGHQVGDSDQRPWHQMGRSGWHIDHDHDTGRVRGILCAGCNIALGAIGEDAYRARALAHYIEDRCN